MLRLSALALGPLLARAAPQIGGRIVDSSATIHRWLTKQYSDRSGTLVSVLTRVVDRSWRALEIALAGTDLLQHGLSILGLIGPWWNKSDSLSLLPFTSQF